MGIIYVAESIKMKYQIHVCVICILFMIVIIITSNLITLSINLIVITVFCMPLIWNLKPRFHIRGMRYGTHVDV